MRGTAARRVHRAGGELRECAMRRAAVSPAERAGMRGIISGSDGLPESERTIRENSMPESDHL